MGGRIAMGTGTNRQVLLVNRPMGEAKESDFALKETPIPEPGPGQFLCRTIYLSLDPYMRGRMRDTASYARPAELGQVMVGGTVSQVTQSKHPDFAGGNFVLGYDGWQEYAVSDGTGVRKVDPGLGPLSYFLGVLGMPGLTAYAGLLDIGRPQPGETVIVSAAPTGSRTSPSR
jgi:NADPH-dependent curcumin reductase CurA